MRAPVDRGDDGDLDPAKKMLSQTHGSRNPALQNDSSEDDLRLPGDISSINSMDEGKQKQDKDGGSIDGGPSQSAAGRPPANMKTSYYVRDKFKPLKSHQDNIEKLLGQFND